MSFNPQPMTNMLRLAAAAFTEAAKAFEEAAALGKPEGKEALAYAYGVATTGLAQVAAAAKQYVSLPECARNEAVLPVLADTAFRSAVGECASALGGLASAFPLAARIEASLRRLIEANNPGEARTLAMVCDTAARSAKMSGARAA
jgi:hypothetical protein